MALHRAFWIRALGGIAFCGTAVLGCGSGSSTGAGGSPRASTSGGSDGQSQAGSAATAGTTLSSGGNSGANSGAGANGGATAAGGTSRGGVDSGAGRSNGNGGTTSDAGTTAMGGATTNGGGAGGARNGRGGRSGMNGGAPGGSGANTGSGGASMGGATGIAGANGGGAGAGAITIPDGYKLVWHDEFDVDGAPDPKNWKFESGFVRNEEDQWYQTANASVTNGELVIEARKEQVKNPNYTGSGDWKTSRQYADYTSSSINTSGLQSWEYGRFELRARIPTAAGMWPAWWTLGVSGEWPSNGEIDIMEYYQNKVLANVACGTSTEWQAKWDSSSKSLSSLGANWSSDFHVWRMDWDDQNITLYLDDQTMNTAVLSSMLNADGSSPFKQKAYMLLNLAVGGSNGGSPDNTTFPQQYEIDYVRVFQKN
jgi:beta-glucanase (GH16 family)